jgi:hypothetical protein
MSASHSDNCEVAWWNDPAVLVRQVSFSASGCTMNYINSITRLLVLAVLVGLIAAAWAGMYAFVFVIVFALLVSLPQILGALGAQQAAAAAPPAKPAGSSAEVVKKEGFVGTQGEYVVGAAENTDLYTVPTANNPFMNVLVSDYKYNVDRPMAGAVDDPQSKQILDDFFRTQWFSDPTDVFGKSQNQRQFITMPSTSIPNDRHSFQNWLYKIPGKTCKEGNRKACLAGTDGGALPWLNME